MIIFVQNRLVCVFVVIHDQNVAYRDRIFGCMYILGIKEDN